MAVGDVRDSQLSARARDGHVWGVPVQMWGTFGILGVCPLLGLWRVGGLDAVQKLRTANQESAAHLGRSMRRSRERRNRDVRVRLMERDELLLEAVNRFRLARTRDLIAVAFAGVHPMTASVRIRRLFDAGFLDVRCADRAAENVYSLGALGKRWAETVGIEVGRVPNGGVAHHLAIVRAWSGIAEGVNRWPGARVELARPDWELREELGQVGLPVVPDLFAVLNIEGGPSVALAVEVDLGTESLRVLERKVAAYDAELGGQHGLFGHRGFGLAVALANPGRRVAIRRLLERRWGGWCVLWTDVEGPAEDVASVMTALTTPAAPPVTGSRNGNGSPGAATADGAIVSGPNRRGL